MMSVLRFGDHEAVALEVSDDATITVCNAPHAQAIDDVRVAVRAALAEPLELPPLVQAVVPGDKVALAIAEGVPQIVAIVEQTVRQLLSAGIAATDITVLGTGGDTSLDATKLAQTGARVAIHDPEHRESLSYLAANAEGKPIYVNRAIHDADLVILIGCARPAGSLGEHGINAELMADFSDTANRDRYRSPKAVLPSRRDHLRVEADEAGWLLGTAYTLRVVPDGFGGALHVLAGDLRAVERQGQRRYLAAWGCEIPERVELVVATIEGDVSQQTWQNLARALESAAAAADSEAAVVICSELDAAPGAGVQQLIGADDLHSALRAIVHNKPADALAAGAIVHALERGRVYLVSRLDDELIEDLGMRPLVAEDLSRLVSQFKSVTVLRNAPYAVAQLRQEVDEVMAPKRRSKK